MIWEPWSRVDETGLARYVSVEAAKSIAMPPFPLDLEPTPANRLAVLRGLYEHLLSLQIQYALEEYHPSVVLQNVRAPSEAASDHQGTCLDLAALFCGLCLRCELLPVLIVLEGHALAAVFLGHGLRQWDGQRPGRALFDAGPLTDPAALREMIGQGLLAAIECTGFARSRRLEEHPSAEFPETLDRHDGVMTFESAQEAGRKQLDGSRKFGFALDIAVAHYGWRITPLPAAPLYASFRAAAGNVRSHILIRQFEATIKDKTEDFVGRRKLVQRIDECLADRKAPSGYVVLRGEPGTGKTALMAHLVRQRAYLHHFNIFNQRIRTAREFLENVCAQVILRYELDQPTLPPAAGKSSGPMVALLEAAVKRANGATIIVVVDALDESEEGASKEGANRLLLPESLPDNVFFLVTTREQVEYRLVVKNRHDLSFHAPEFKDQNEEDIRAYIEQFLARNAEPMQAAMARWHVGAAEFTRVVSERSTGNFMYLIHVLKDIRDRKITKESLDRIEELPEGLVEYYARHWRMMGNLDRRRFEKYYEPVVCILAAVRQPVELSYVRELTHLDTARLKEVIEEWRQFLRVDQMPNGTPFVWVIPGPTRTASSRLFVAPRIPTCA